MSLLRKVMFWLTMVALPLQGFAAVAGLHCATQRHEAHAPASPVSTNATTFHSAHASHADAVATMADLGLAADDGFVDAPAWDTPSSDPTCSACAACSGLAALPPAPTVGAIFVHGDAVPQAPPAETLPFETEGPDRPPRLTLA